MLLVLNAPACNLPLASNNTVEPGPTILLSNVVLALNVLAPAIVCAPLVLTTVASTVISSAAAVIPSPPTTFKVTAPEVPPPVKPVPAPTLSMSPASLVKLITPV